MSQQTTQRNHLPTWLIIVGIPIAIVGGIIMAVASSKAGYARNVGDLTEAMGGPGGYNVDLEAAVTLGHWGLGVLILGVVLVLIGIAALAVRRTS
jgi:multisubunit Na+/H+ antiporter MnhG subunit